MITANDKIIRFNNLEELKKAIGDDLESKDVLAQRYCVRFIMLNDFKTFNKLTKFLVTELGVKIFEIQDLILGDDKTVTIDMLSEAVKDITETSIITPFSELVRFYREEDFNGFFNEIILTEDLKHPQKRIYIPIIGLNNRFNDFLKNFGRIQESAPIWQLYSPNDDKVKVYISKFKIPSKVENAEYCKLETMKDWLNFWRKQAPKDKILSSAKPIRFGWKNSRPDSIFTFEEVTNIYEYLTEFLGLSIPFNYVQSESNYWEKLLDEISLTPNEIFNWKRYTERYFNTLRFTVSRILEIWADERRTEYERWLLRNYILNSNQVGISSYLRLCIEEITEYSNPAELFVRISERIFYSVAESEIERFANERCEIMSSNHGLFIENVPKNNQEWIKEHIISIAQNESNLRTAKILCTGTFDFEKELFFGWYQLRADKDFGMDNLKEFFPDLHAYLFANDVSYYRPGAEWLADYFRAYRDAKIKDEYTDDIKSFIETYNADDSKFWDWYYKHNTCHDLYYERLSKTDSKPDKVYWIDGLGAEFIPFIQYLVATSGSKYEVVEAQAATTGLPSNTSLNKFDVDDKVLFKFGELDALAHSNHYRTRKTLIEELAIIKKIIAAILKDNSVGNHTIAIVSDHGLSALSRLREPRKISGISHHEGRYIPYSSAIAAESMPEYITVKNPDDNLDYKVALTHASLGRKPSHEVHGGCTPEEVLVPFIVITNEDASKPVKYDIRPIEVDLPVSDPLFECIIIPEPVSAHMIIGSDKIEMESVGTKWFGKIPNATEGRITVNVQPYRGKIQSFEVNIFGIGMGDSLSDFDM